MAKLILASQCEADPATGHLGLHGRVEATHLAESIAQVVDLIHIDTAFAPSTLAAKDTLDVIAGRQAVGERAVVRSLVEPADTQVSNELVRLARRQVAPFHRRMVLPRMVRDRTVLVVAGPNAARAYIQVVEGVNANDNIGEVDLLSPLAVLYDISQRGRLIGATLLRNTGSKTASRWVS